MIEPWEKLDSQYLGDFRIFRIRQDTSRSPRTGAAHRFFVLESPDWVNVIPLTPEGNVIMIRQYRHGTEDVTLEVPGGMVDADDGDPSVSAARELREETGYEVEEIIHLGSVAPNPAFLNNQLPLLSGPGRPSGARGGPRRGRRHRLRGNSPGGHPRPDPRRGDHPLVDHHGVSLFGSL
jgi:8-oxo-dGTP pyrophosphatase MutT (NUDIX family)